MSHSRAEARVPASARPFFASLLLLLAGALFLWGEIVWQLASEWSLNPQYGYGWIVPFLAALLFYQRWLRRPNR